MSKKRTLTVIFSLAMALAMFAGVWQPASAAFITKNGYAVGNQGIFIPGGLNPDIAWATKANRSSLGFTPIRFSRDPIMLHFENTSGSKVNTPFVLSYVFFKLYPWEERAYKNGDLGIWYKDVNTHQWKQCSSFLIPSNKKDEKPRLACAVTQWNTTYGIAEKR